VTHRTRHAPAGRKRWFLVPPDKTFFSRKPTKKFVQEDVAAAIAQRDRSDDDDDHHHGRSADGGTGQSAGDIPVASGGRGGGGGGGTGGGGNGGGVGSLGDSSNTTLSGRAVMGGGKGTPANPYAPFMRACVQEAGDVIYVPHRWGHATLNLEASIGIAEEFLFTPLAGWKAALF
jgi:hypothetical protein